MNKQPEGRNAVLTETNHTAIYQKICHFGWYALLASREQKLLKPTAMA